VVGFVVVRFTSVPVCSVIVSACVSSTPALCVYPPAPPGVFGHTRHTGFTHPKKTGTGPTHGRRRTQTLGQTTAHTAADSREASDPYLVVPTSSAYKSEVLSAQAVDHAQLGHVRKQVALKHALRRRPKWYLFDPEYLHRPSGWVFVPA